MIEAVKQMKKIYVASSWRNLLQPAIVTMCRKCGFDTYDFKNPPGGGNGFNWRKIDPHWQSWNVEEYREALKHLIAKAGYKSDIDALRECDICILVLPSGRSASWEFGYAMAQGKRGIVVSLEKCEPELMYSEAEIVANMDELFDALGFPP